MSILKHARSQQMALIAREIWMEVIVKKKSALSRQTTVSVEGLAQR